MMKEKNMTFLVFIFCFLSSPLVSAQTITKINTNHFEYLGQTYKYEEMSHVFMDHQEAAGRYMKSINSRKTSKKSGYVALVSLAFGGLMVAIESSADDRELFEIGTAGALGIISWFVVLPIAATTSLVSVVVSDSNEKKSIELFNNVSSDQLPEPKSVELGLILNRNIGLQLRF